MTRRTLASKYARLLLDIAVKDGDPDEVERGLTDFATLVAEHPSLASALAAPTVPTPRKRALVGAILARSQAESTIAGRLVLLLTEQDRLSVLPELLSAYRERLLDHRQVVRAEVTTAIPLEDTRAAALTDSLQRVTGKQVSLITRVDPSIIGGVVTRVGSIVYDGSVARQLARLEERMVADQGSPAAAPGRA